MFDADTRALLRSILDEVCGQIDQYQIATRAHVAAQILAAAGRDATPDHIREAGIDALKSAPTMWR
ncbi:hypothetical protein [Bradyrhizobium guangdongense]|uniref:Uncharacterized protein n=1 Tax=Bradyrhizobium guangdongense TaxID=1325090 RepID=A0ABX6UGT5_9BRAD|nr:hypothetical protein [Bradyrhizobium guangdongense]QAU39467.1 hypothetical protein X265_18700 [Bradyrhizobium guangdongense]QOZ60526.1 hypothetical protein XH86_18710 [Bradyrhizobium guangdongense]